MRALSGRRPRGFTLIELLVACCLTMMMVGLVLKAFSATATLWRRAEGRNDTFREARAALDIMARDLRMTAVAAQPGAPTLALDYNPATPEADRVNEEAYAITSQPNRGRSDLCTVGYYCVWDSLAHAYALRRCFKESDATFNGFKVPVAEPWPIFSHAGAAEEEVAGTVWDLTFRPCENGVVAGSYPRAVYSDTLPLWIEIRFKAMGASAAARLKSLPVTRETWQDPGGALYKTAILPFQQQFVVRVRLNCASNP